MRLSQAGLVIAMALLPMGVTTAQTADDANIAGHWTFTAQLEIDCSFAGTARFEHQGDNKYTGELVATQSCPELEQDFVVRQDCRISQINSQVSVRCTIVEFINGFESGAYYPDNFALTVASPKRMYGALVSAGDAKPAEWLRSEGAIS